MNGADPASDAVGNIKTPPPDHNAPSAPTASESPPPASNMNPLMLSGGSVRGRMAKGSVEGHVVVVVAIIEGYGEVFTLLPLLICIWKFGPGT
ncbi:hypothetical protein BU17DRAFT_85355 [Hysterangium stoloniferum]|nr:hypothetical protein BU17DRAFT_85355 [Hysterangium stoloniferum]